MSTFQIATFFKLMGDGENCPVNRASGAVINIITTPSLEGVFCKLIGKRKRKIRNLTFRQKVLMYFLLVYGVEDFY